MTPTWHDGLPTKEGIYALSFHGETPEIIRLHKGGFENAFGLELRRSSLTHGHYWGPIPPPPEED